ncbi:universal stress protein family domain-containing protein [Histoplasma capsulatum var. duboisii H88]|uniref:Universal stress protein family domain-containing protein n=1 Tax=Ajellomyces capsulatus (strain H88) TaxID=544711 RepID=A0A8A1L7Y5_AJEC8|nr:universal stress protein family domain-containing protein [Histoplasma capsulatum var. duboisii H88]
MSKSASTNTWPDTSSSALGSDGTASSHRDDASVFTLGGSTAMPTDVPPRRQSIQFNMEAAAAELSKKRIGATRGTLTSRIGRMPSPPPPSAYNRGVSFDTFDNRDATDFSLTLNYKHRDYHPTRRSRTFLCGTDQNDYSDFALEWLIDELVDDGDEIVCLRVVEKDSKIANDASMEERRYRQEAQKLLDQVIAKNSHDEKTISLVLEFAVGKVQEIIQRMIQIYEPSALIVGTRGRSLGGMQGLLPGSVSKYCLQQSPIPVIVVRSSTKREKKKQKRLGNPTRHRYNHILRLNDMKSGRVFDKARNSDSIATKQPEEEAAVAQAIGEQDMGGSLAIRNTSRDPRLSFSRDTASTRSTDDKDDTSEGTRSLSIPNSESAAPNFSSALKNQRIESPAITDDEGDEDEGDSPGDDNDYDSEARDRSRQHGSQDAAPSPKKPPLVPITNATTTEYTSDVDERH